MNINKYLLVSIGIFLFVLSANTASAALQYVGGNEVAGTNASLTLSLTALTGGIASAAAANDLVYVATGFVSTANLDPGVSTAGYTEIADLYQNDTNDTNFSANWKIMGATPDASVACNGSDASTNVSICAVHVWRGADTGTPMDVLDVSANAANSGVPNPGAITPVTSGAFVVVSGGGTSASAITEVTAPTGYGNMVSANPASDPGLTFRIGIASKAWTSGAEDAGTFGGFDTSNVNSWGANTIAIRPAVAPTVTTSAASGVTDVAATLNGNITVTGGINSTTRGFAWGTDSTLSGAGTATTTESGNFGVAAFTSALSGLTCGTTYYSRAYATNSIGTGFGAIVSFATSACPVIADTLEITGNIYSDEGITLDTTSRVIKLVVATSTVAPGIYATTTNTGSARWGFRINWPGFANATGTPVLAFVDADATFRAATMNKASSTFTSLLNFDLYKNRVVAKHALAQATSTTNSDFSKYDADDDVDVPFSANGGALNVFAGNMLYVAPGSEFAPGGAVTIHGNAQAGPIDGSLKLPVGVGQTGSATSSILTLGGALQIGGSYFASSTSILSPGTNTVTLSATTTGKQIYATTTPFYNLTFAGSGGTAGGWTFQGNASTTNNFTITDGTVIAPSTFLSVGVNYSNSGTFTNNSGKVLFDGAGAQSFSGTMTGTSAFANVEFSGAGTKSFGANNASSTNFTIRSASGAVTAPSTLLSIGGNFTNNSTFSRNNGTLLFDGPAAQTIGGTLAGTSALANIRFLGAGAKTISSNASTTDFIIMATGTPAVTAPSLLSIGGNFTNNSTFSNNAGTILFDGQAAQTLGGTMTGTSAFDNLTFLGAGGKTFGSTNASSTGNFIIMATGTPTVTGSSALLSVGGDFTNNSTFSNNAGTVLFDGPAAQTIGGTLAGTSALANIRFLGAGAKTISSNASTTDFIIMATGTPAVTAPSFMSITGNYTNNSTFTHGSGNVLLDGTSQQTLSGALGAGSAFNNLEIINSSGGGDATNTPSVIFASAASTTGTFLARTANVTGRLPVATSTFQNINWNGQGAGTEVKFRSATPGTRFGLRVPGTVSVSRVDFMDTGACDSASTIDASTGNNIDSGNNQCVNFVAAAEPTISSSANQTFGLNQASTAMSQVTLTGGTGAKVFSATDATGDIRIAIATSTVNMRWDTTVTASSFTFGGAGSAKINTATVYYEGGNGGDSVLRLDVTTNFADSEQLTISGGKFKSFGTINAAANGLRVYREGPADGTVDATDDKTITITGSLALSTHASGQELNKLDTGGTSVSNAELFNFTLAPSGENINVSSLKIDLDQIVGFACGNLSTIQLFIDFTANADVDAWETATGTPACSINSGAGTGSITFSPGFQATTSRSYIMRAGTVSENNPGNKINFSLPASNITSAGQTTSGSITASGSVNSVTHFRTSLQGTSPLTETPANEIPRGGGTQQSSGSGSESGGGAPPGEVPAGGGSQQGAGGESGFIPNTKMLASAFFTGFVKILGLLSLIF